MYKVATHWHTSRKMAPLCRCRHQSSSVHSKREAQCSCSLCSTQGPRSDLDHCFTNNINSSLYYITVVISLLKLESSASDKNSTTVIFVFFSRACISIGFLARLAEHFTRKWLSYVLFIAIANPSVACRLSSAMFVRPTQGVETFDNRPLSSQFSTVAILWSPWEIVRRWS